ncbi:MAG: hypothetical protein JWQ59_231 [Cryobacterium sp.]|nr:hypothetical protein [Cryobacterium sp.]
MEARYRLVWPKPLFLWEANRVRSLPEEIVFPAINHLLSEAFEDPAVSTSFASQVGTRNIWAIDDRMLNVRGWLEDLIGDDSRLTPYSPPRYYAERAGQASVPSNPYEALGVEYATFLREMQDLGYFPVALPRFCVDADDDWAGVSVRVRRAIHMPFNWDGKPVMGADWDRPLLLSLMEYFHDHAQRPRTISRIHEYGGCGPHYAEHSAESGAAVYRWRVNEMLMRHRVELTLGRAGEERGRLIRRFGTPLDDAADTRAAEGEGDPLDEVAHAIREFRGRSASSAQKRMALALLAGALESRRAQAKVVLGKDERDLFNIANNFGIRHRNDHQRMDYGDEFLDYLFNAYLSAVKLLEALDVRDAGRTATVSSDAP